MKKNPEKYYVTAARIVDESEREINTGAWKGKVILVDIWHSACLPCIKRFPEIQKLYDHYRYDTLVKIISLNFPLAKDNGVRPSKLTSNYSFDKMYFLNEHEYDKFSHTKEPLILILDRKLHCRYAGDLNLGWNILFGNARRVINKLRKEQ